jgi:hypothetical protein
LFSLHFSTFELDSRLFLFILLTLSSSVARTTIDLGRREDIEEAVERGAGAKEASRHGDASIDDGDDCFVIVAAGLVAVANRGVRDAESIAGAVTKTPGLDGGTEAAWMGMPGHAERGWAIEKVEKVKRGEKKKSLFFWGKILPF